MSDSCTHDLADREVACNDGMCPICLAERNAKLLAALRELVALDDGDDPYWWKDKVRAIVNRAVAALQSERSDR